MSLACLLLDKDKQHVTVQSPGRGEEHLGCGWRDTGCVTAQRYSHWLEAEIRPGDGELQHDLGMFLRGFPAVLCLRVTVWRQAAHVDVLEGECCSAGPLTDWHKGAESAAGFEVLMIKCYQLLIISMPYGRAAVSRYVLGTKETQKLYNLSLLLVIQEFNLGHRYQDSIMVNTGSGPGDTETGYGLCAEVATANRGNAHDSALTTGALLICARGTATAQINTPAGVYF